MSLLKIFSKASHGDVSETAVSDHDASADLPSEAESDAPSSHLRSPLFIYSKIATGRLSSAGFK